MKNQAESFKSTGMVAHHGPTIRGDLDSAILTSSAGHQISPIGSDSDGKHSSTRPANNEGVGNAVPAGVAKSKAACLAEVMSRPETNHQIGAAWFLYCRLVLIEDGRMVGSYDEIGIQLGVSGKTVRNWVKAMEEAGIVSAETKGHRVRVSLLGEHLEAALAQDQVVQVMTSDATSVAAMSPEMRNATRLLEAAEQVGAPIELRAVIAWTR